MIVDQSMQNKTVLLIEDNNRDAQFLHSLLPAETHVIHILYPQEVRRVLKTDYVDVILVDVSTTPTEQWKPLRQTLPDDIPVVFLIDEAQEQPGFTDVADEHTQEYLVKAQLTAPLLKSVMHYAISRAALLATSRRTLEYYQRLLDDQKILERIDRELGYTLNIDRVLHLALDTATRLTGASSCVIGWIDQDMQRLAKLAGIGRHQFLAQPIPLNYLPDHDLISRALAASSHVMEPAARENYFHLLLPLIIQGKAAGLIILENIHADFCCEKEDIEFLIHLASRTAAGLEKTRIYQQLQRQAGQMDRLYWLSTDINRHLDRQEVMEANAASMAVLLEGSSAFFCEYQRPANYLIVRATFITDGAKDQLPSPGTPIEMVRFPGLLDALHTTPIQIRQQDPAIEPERLAFSQFLGLKSLLLVPVQDEDRLVGVIVLCESRFDRFFSADEIRIARSLGGGAAVALTKATLFANIQQLEQLKSEMIRMASHDLRTPLSRIIFSSAMMEPEVAPGSMQEELLNTIKEAATQMQSLLEDILNLERIESSEVSEQHPIDVVNLIRKVCDSFHQQAAMHSQSFIVDLPENAVIVVGSEVQLREAYSNLIGNAFKYTPDGGTVTVRASTNANRLNFEVEDTGYGIPPERQEKIFKRFYRAHTPGTEAIPGTGLGLSLVKTVIERHGGEVWFRSQLAVGSVFGCWVPLQPA